MSAPSSFPSTTASPSPTPAAPTDPGTAGSPSGRSRRGAGPGPAVLLVLGSCLSLQFGAVGAAALFPALGSAGTTMLRLGFAAVLMLALVRPRLRGWSAIQWRATIALGLALAGMNGSFYAAIARIPLGAAVAIEFLGPLALAAVLTRRGRDLAWVALALAGIGLLGAESLLTPATLDPVGVALALVAGVFWAGYIITGARVGALMPGAGGLAVALLVATLVVAPFGAVGALRAVGHPDLLLLGGLTAVLASVVPYSLELTALRRVPRHVFGVLLSLEPAVATLVGLLLLDQPTGALRLGAIALVVAASVGSSWSTSRSSREPEATPQPDLSPQTDRPSDR